MKKCGKYRKELDEKNVEKVLKEISDNHGYNINHRIWAKKEEFQQGTSIEIIMNNENTLIY